MQRAASTVWVGRLTWLLLTFSLAAGCAQDPAFLFPGVANIAELKPDERVVVGQIQYVNGDLSRWLPGSYRDSWPRFTYDFWHAQSPRYDKPIRAPAFGPGGGVFAFRVKRLQPVYLADIKVETSQLLVNKALWTLPVVARLPATTAPCAFVGTIMIEVSGPVPDMPSGWSGGWLNPRSDKATDERIKVTILDTYDRDRQTLSTYVVGCDLQRALAQPVTAQEIDAVLAPNRAAIEAERARRSAQVQYRK